MRVEGWFKDPYGRHEARWFSNGALTSLVRDGSTTATDPPPSWGYQGVLEPVDEPAHTKVFDGTEPGFFRRVVELIIDVVPW